MRNMKNTLFFVLCYIVVIFISILVNILGICDDVKLYVLVFGHF